MNNKQITLYDIDCQVKKELGLKPIPRDCFHDDIILEREDIDTFKKEWTELTKYTHKVMSEIGED
ncbi:hypothetical protein [Enterococcus sp. AZ007]|uniref:hypothetical protein n=1 Tax=Enterococcus sp. AZ007 TaxID=2774839 RepID=UPI003F275109